MRQISDGLAPEEIPLLPALGPLADPMRRGFIGSVALHVVVVLLALWGWSRTLPPPPEERVLPINLVQFGEKTSAPPSTLQAPLPQEQAKEVSKLQPPEAVPVPQPQPGNAPRQEASSPAEAKPSRAPEPPKPVKVFKPQEPSTAKQRPAPQTDDLGARLQKLAQLRQPTPPIPPNPRQQEGSGSSNLTASSADAEAAPDAAYSVKDFLRAQIERRWNLNRAALKGHDWVVSIHIVLNRNGSVSRAEIVDDTRYRANDDYRDFALSARNAVLLSSPLVVPPGKYDLVKDITLDFNPKRISR